MDKKQIIDKTAKFVEGKLSGEGSGHDWWHIHRVRQNAKLIGKGENVDMFVVELAALLHDIADWKFNDGDDSVGPRIAGEWLEKLGVDDGTIKIIKEIIKGVSFKGVGAKQAIMSKEGEVVQDADRLDAIGAVGVARCFAYGGYKGREIYDPNTKPVMHETAQQYKTNTSPSINHFYEKLLLLKDLMNTQTARKIASTRHKFMKEFLDEFFTEWEGKR